MEGCLPPWRWVLWEHGPNETKKQKLEEAYEDVTLMAHLYFRHVDDKECCQKHPPCFISWIMLIRHCYCERSAITSIEKKQQPNTNTNCISGRSCHASDACGFSDGDGAVRDDCCTVDGLGLGRGAGEYDPLPPLLLELELLELPH